LQRGIHGTRRFVQGQQLLDLVRRQRTAGRQPAPCSFDGWNAKRECIGDVDRDALSVVLLGLDLGDLTRLGCVAGLPLRNSLTARLRSVPTLARALEAGVIQLAAVAPALAVQ
jgi:hypothetical protein